MTTPKLDFEWEIPQFRHALFIDGDEVDSDNFLFNKLRQLCQAVDEINQQLQINEMHVKHHMDFINSMNDKLFDIKDHLEHSNRIDLEKIFSRLKDIESRQKESMAEEGSMHHIKCFAHNGGLCSCETYISKKECNHDFDTTMILTSNPPSIKCKSCGFTKVFGSTPDVFMKAECDHIWEAYTQCGNPNAPAIPACIKCGKIK